MIQRIQTIGIFSTLFLTSYVLFLEPFEGYIPYLFMILYTPFLAYRYALPKGMWHIIFVIIASGLLGIYVGDNELGNLVKILTTILISLFFFNGVFHVYKFDVEKLFKYYLIMAKWVSFIGIFQFISYQIGFEPGYNFRWIFNKWALTPGGVFGLRVNSIYSEPSYFASSMAPAFFLGLYNLIFRDSLYISRRMSLIFVFTYLLTFSTVGYTAIFVAFMLILVNVGFLRYVLIFAPLIVAGHLYLYYNLPDYQERIDGLTELYSGEVKSSYEVHGSSFVLYNNYTIAAKNLSNNPFFGTGLGSHEVAYSKYSLVEEYGGIYDFNKKDANSMAIRLLSETGLFGIIFFIYIIVKFYVIRDKSNENDKLWVISNATLLIIFLQLFRQGNYTYNGFFFYLFLYYFVHRVKMDRDNPDQITEDEKSTLSLQ